MGAIIWLGNKPPHEVFDALRTLVQPWITLDTATRIQFQAPTGIAYDMSMSSDPDIRLDEIILAAGTAATRRALVAMENKGGRDASNAHNRAGEAEKSHIKAAALGYVHRWTIMVMQGLDRQRIRRETPSSTAVFDVAEIGRRSGADWDSLKQRLGAVIGLPVP